MIYHLLNLSTGAKNLNVHPCLGQPEAITDLANIPQKDRKEPLILYILGHAAPDELFVGDRKVEDTEIMNSIEKARTDAKTLLIWDVCFAKSFLNTSRQQPWPSNYVHMFACQRYERSWHQGGKRNETTFSAVLCEALQEYKPQQDELTWEGLGLLLNSKFGHTQTADIVHLGQLTVQDFQGLLFEDSKQVAS